MRLIRIFLLPTLMAVALVAVPGATAVPAPAPTLSVLGKGSSELQTVTLTRSSDETLHGTLSVPLQSAVNGVPTVTYYPAGGAAGPTAGSVSLGDKGAAELKQDRIVSAQLVFTLPATASPDDLNGIVAIRAQVDGAGIGDPAKLEVIGAGDPLAGISVQPEQLKIQVSGAPLDTPDGATANIRLSGPGVPRLLQTGTGSPPFNLLLRSDHGDEVTAKLVNLEQIAGSPTSARGTVEVKGKLDVGKYEGAAPISSLSVAAPKLSVTVESGSPFFYVLFLVGLGTLTGGALYLASGRRRRKALLQDQVKSLLSLYRTRLEELEEDQRSRDGQGTLPVKPLGEYLGPPENWYQIKWNAIIEFDGAAQSIWSAIHWAKDDSDLDEAGKQVDKLRERVIRWLTIANGVAALEQAAALEPDEHGTEPWRDRRACRDTNFLLRLVRGIEPADDATAKSLVDRIARQAHWHTVLARVWHARTKLDDAMRADRDKEKYSDNDREMLAALNFKKLDCAAWPESGRTAEKQIELEQDLAAYAQKIVRTYKGDTADLVLGSAHKGKAADTAATASAIFEMGLVYTAADRGLITPALTDATREANKVSRKASLMRSPNVLGQTLRRDLFWTAAIATASSAAYALTIYSSTWGTATDYVGAFTAGFLGKAAINWAALPLFQSLRAATSPAVTATDAKPAETESKDAEATDPAAAPAKPAAPSETVPVVA